MGIDLYNLVISAKLQKGGGGGGDVTVEELNVTSNGSYSASSGYAYSPVNVSVPGIVPSGTSAITANGIYDVTNFASASVSVPGIVPSGTSSISANGIYDITSFASVDVNVSGGGGGITADEVAMRTISGAVIGNSATKVDQYAFTNCSLITASFPSAISIGNNAFTNCFGLTTANFPNVTSIGNNAFQTCSGLITVSFPSAISIGNGAFQNCSGLTTASFPSVTSIGTAAFYNCRSLTTAIFLTSSVPTLLNANVFTSTPMSNSTYTGSFGSIYVPASLVDSYKAAANWSAYADRITAYTE